MELEILSCLWSWMPCCSLLIIVLLVTYCTYMSRDYGLFKSMGIPGPKPFPVLGNTMPYFTVGVHNAQEAWWKEYGRIYGIFEMNTPNLFIGDPDILREILVKQFHNFTNRREPGKRRPPYDIPKMLTVLKDEHWKHVRNNVSSTFSSGKLKKMTLLINDACDKFVANLTKKAENGGDIDIKEACLSFSVDVIGSAAFGIDINSQSNPDHPLIFHKKEFYNASPLLLIVQMFFPRLIPLFDKIPSARKRAITYFKDLVKETFRERKEGTVTRNDFLQLMIESAKADTARDDKPKSNTATNDETGETSRRGLSFDEILAQSMIFFLGGLEATATTLAMAFYSLALHPDILEKTLEEIDRVLGNDDCITYDKIRQLCYLEQVICESQRVYSSSVRIDRVCSATTTIKGITIPKDMVVSIPIPSIHTDPEFWPEPEKFDPDRFRADVKGDINPFTFLPFGHGPRNCLAMRLGVMKVKLAAARVLQKLRPIKVPRTREKPEYAKSKTGFLNIKGGVWIGLEKRQ